MKPVERYTLLKNQIDQIFQKEYSFISPTSLLDIPCSIFDIHTTILTTISLSKEASDVPASFTPTLFKL
jgi:hypothetical protein